MSVVTNVILKISIGDKRQIGALNDIFNAGQKFVSCDDEPLPRGWYAGSKMLECEILPGAFNYLNLADLTNAIQTVEWFNPHSVQLFVQEQEQDRFREVDLGF